MLSWTPGAINLCVCHHVTHGSTFGGPYLLESAPTSAPLFGPSWWGKGLEWPIKCRIAPFFCWVAQVWYLGLWDHHLAENPTDISNFVSPSLASWPWPECPKQGQLGPHRPSFGCCERNFGLGMSQMAFPHSPGVWQGHHNICWAPWYLPKPNFKSCTTFYKYILLRSQLCNLPTTLCAGQLALLEMIGYLNFSCLVSKSSQISIWL